MMLCKILLLVLGSGLHISNTKRQEYQSPPAVDEITPIAGGNKTIDASGVVCIVDVIVKNKTKLSTKRQLKLGLT